MKSSAMFGLTLAAILMTACVDANSKYHSNVVRSQGQNVIAAFDFNTGIFRGSVRLSSDFALGGVSAKNLEELRSKLYFSEEMQYQLQMITKQVLEAFGLYEPFRRKTKAITLNNPVYYGVKSGMVNYLKNIYKGQTSSERPPPEGFEWKGIDGSKPIEA